MNDKTTSAREYTLEGWLGLLHNDHSAVAEYRQLRADAEKYRKIVKVIENYVKADRHGYVVSWWSLIGEIERIIKEGA